LLRAALRGALGEAVSAAGAVAGLASLSNHAREEMAVRDCVELLGYSVDELGWSLDAMAEPGDLVATAEPDASDHGAARRAEEDVHAWLSAARGNQDTCVEGFHHGAGGGDGRLLRQVQEAVVQLRQLVSNLLAMHKHLRSITTPPLRHHGRPNNATSSSSSSDLPPPWAVDDVDENEELTTTRTKKKPTRVDVVVAQDGSGRYRTVGEAVARAPSHSKRRHVIYVKRGVYHENVEVKKKKTNIVIVGEGMGETVISGSRSIAGGWTTFRSATVGKCFRSAIDPVRVRFTSVCRCSQVSYCTIELPCTSVMHAPMLAYKLKQWTR
jgi:pectinesterase